MSHQRLLKKKEEMLEGSRTNPVMRVNFFEKLYDGVQILAGEDAFSTKQPLDGPGSLDYIAEEKTFKVGELKGLECSIHTST